MKYLYFLLSLSLIIFISCQSDRENQPVSPSEEDVEIIENAIFHDIINANSHILTFQKHDSLSISFHREHKDSAWSSISFGRWPHKAFDNPDTIKLSTYIGQLDTCWNYVAKLGSINIKSLGVLSPQHYPDILKNQVNAFNKDKAWRNDSLNNNIDNKKTLMLSKTYEWSEYVMLKHNVYQPINDFLKQKGFEISGFALEKMSEVSEKRQKGLGIDSIMLVPNPLAINIYVNELNHKPNKPNLLPNPDTSVNYNAHGSLYTIIQYLKQHFYVLELPKAYEKSFWVDSISEVITVDIDDNNPEAEECGFQSVYNKNIIFEESNCEGDSKNILFVNYTFEEVMRIMKILNPKKCYDDSNYCNDWIYENDGARYDLQEDCSLSVKGKGTDTIRVEIWCFVCNA